MDETFEPKVELYTVIYNTNGEEIERKQGHIVIKARDYAEHLPIEYKHITITTETTLIAKIEK